MMRGSFLARRVKYSRLLLATVLLTVLATVALGAAQSLPQAVRGQLTRSPALSIAVHRAIAAPQVGPVGRLVRPDSGRALAGVPYRLDQALWSDPLALAAPRGSKTIPLVEVAAAGQIQARAVLTAGT